jgi:hypothetical protein
MLVSPAIALPRQSTAMLCRRCCEPSGFSPGFVAPRLPAKLANLKLPT